MELGEAISKSLEFIMLAPGVGVKNRVLLEDNQYYYTGEYDYAVGVGLIPPCDIELYKSKGHEVVKVEKWARGGCFAL